MKLLYLKCYVKFNLNTHLLTRESIHGLKSHTKVRSAKVPVATWWTWCRVFTRISMINLFQKIPLMEVEKLHFYLFSLMFLLHVASRSAVSTVPNVMMWVTSRNFQHCLHNLVLSTTFIWSVMIFDLGIQLQWRSPRHWTRTSSSWTTRPNKQCWATWRTWTLVHCISTFGRF